MWRSVVELSPSCPRALSPQQRTVPLARTAQLWRPLTDSATASESPDTATGTRRSVVELSPSCPCKLLPQQTTAPFACNAQTCAPSPAVLSIGTFDKPPTFT